MKKIYLFMLQIIILLAINTKNVYASINLNCNNLNLGIDYSITLKPIGDTSGSLIWTSTNPEIAIVENGIITGKSIGTTYINVNNGKSADVCKVNVINNYIPITNLSLDKTEDTILLGETKKINATISPSNASNKTIHYISNNPSIVSVDAEGNITGKKVGTAYISMTAESKANSYKVTVIDTVNLKGISIKSSLEIQEGKSDRLTVTYNPSNATNKKVTWKSSNTKIVTVDGNGNINAISKGSATITAISSDGSHVATSKITVTAIDKSLKSISLNKTELTLEVGKEETLTVTYNPSNAENKKVTWKSSNEKVAKVNDGKISTIKPGTTEITVTSEDGNHEATCKLTVLSLPIESIAFEKDSMEVYIGSTTTLNTISTPKDTIINNPIWTSSEESVATVENGVVTALKLGTTIIKVSDEEDKINASITINVIEKPEEPLMITIEGYELNFDPNNKNYTLLIGNESSLVIKTNKDDNEIIIGGNRDLKNGSIITVTTKGKNEPTYVINIKKKDNYTIYFIAIISILLFLNIIRLLIKNKKNK